MKRNGNVLLPLIVFAIATFGVGSLALTPLMAQSQAFPAAAGQTVTIEGRLELNSQNYFLDPRFVIIDDQNNRIPITAWAPLEVPPPPPGRPAPAARIRTMEEYLNKRLSVTGVMRTGTANQGPRALAAPGQSYLEVQAVVDAATGNGLFDARGATASAGPTPASSGTASVTALPTEGPFAPTAQTSRPAASIGGRGRAFSPAGTRVLPVTGRAPASAATRVPVVRRPVRASQPIAAPAGKQ